MNIYIHLYSSCTLEEKQDLENSPDALSKGRLPNWAIADPGSKAEASLTK